MDELSNIHVITLAISNETQAYPKITQNKSSGWINYGPKNDFPQTLINLNARSPVNSSIIDSTVTYICGKGAHSTAKESGAYIGNPNPAQTWDQVIKPLARDYKTFGGFVGQVILNKGSKTVSVFHQDFSACRIGRISDTGKPLTFRISNDWKKTTGLFKPIELEVWPGIQKAKKGQAYIFYHFDYSPGINYYCVPGYFPAMEYIKADGTLAAFYNNSIDNGFTPSVTISMPSNPPKAEKDAFQLAMEKAYTGAKGACSVVIIWGEDGEVAPKIVPFAATANADVYNNVEKIVFQKIISAHRLASPTLAGVSGSGNLSGNAAEIVDAYILYNYTVIDDMRNNILDALNVFTNINGYKPLLIDDLDVIGKIQEAKGNSNEQILTIKDGNKGQAPVESLASKLGVGGTQALTETMANPNLTDTQKRGIMAVLFGLSQDDIDSLFNNKVAQKPNFKTRLKTFLDKWK